jgi:hypothetical protein
MPFASIEEHFLLGQRFLNAREFGRHYGIASQKELDCGSDGAEV